ncbi:hypothetical protein ABLE91_03630 [Aquabacter sp. CN5-332]|uniref:ImuA family protein n=1 Tax=Aquabacter sp. CN5-332 TaxID=3156608 RepID=UPI0032B346B2
MSHPNAAAADIAGLRRRIAAIESGGGTAGEPLEDIGGWLPFGIPAVDGPLGGGLALGALHEASAKAPGTEGALTAFGLALAAQAAKAGRRPVLVVQQELAAFEAGGLYGPGLEEIGLPEGTLVLVRVRKVQDVLLVMEEALKCTGLSAVLGEVAAPLPEPLTATRRLSLAARAGGTLGLLLRQSRDPEPCAALTRWVIGHALSRPRDAYGGLGPACLSATLTRNRHGPPGQWTLALQGSAFSLAPPEGLRHEPGDPAPRDLRAPLSQPVARPPLHGPHRAAIVA